MPLNIVNRSFSDNLNVFAIQSKIIGQREMLASYAFGLPLRAGCEGQSRSRVRPHSDSWA